MGFLIAGTVFASLGALGVLALAIALALPLAWLWMLIDALLREECDYPGATATSQNRLLWVLLILFVHVAALAYFFMVYRVAPRGVRPSAVAAA
jgi:hypothetical protein